MSSANNQWSNDAFSTININYFALYEQNLDPHYFHDLRCSCLWMNVYHTNTQKSKLKYPKKIYPKKYKKRIFCCILIHECCKRQIFSMRMRILYCKFGPGFSTFIMVKLYNVCLFVQHCTIICTYFIFLQSSYFWHIS